MRDGIGTMGRAGTALVALVALLGVTACETSDGGGATGADGAGGDAAVGADTAAGDDIAAGADTAAGPLAIVGRYGDGYGTEHEITETTWTIGYGPSASRFHVTQFDNDAGWLVAENDAANEWSPSLWSRFDWTRDGADLWYCQTAFDAADEAAALATPAADASDPANGGCGGFAWSPLVPGQGALAIVGTYTDGWGGAHAVTADTWAQTNEDTPEYDSTFAIAAYDNAAMYLVAQNDAANPFSPSLWSRFDWTWHEDALWFCQTVYDAATREAAAAAPAADATDPASGGCGAAAWSRLTPVAAE